MTTLVRSMLLVWGVGCHEPDPLSPKDLCADDPTGVVCTIAGTGLRGANGDDLAALETHLFLPSSVDVDPDGRIVIVDFNNMRIRRLEDDGVLATVAGNGQHSYASEAVPPRSTAIENPIGLAIGEDSRIFVTELHGARVLVIEDDLLRTYAGSAVSPGYPDYSGDGGLAVSAGLSEAVGLAVAPDGTLYIADTENNCVRRVTPDGIIDTVAGNGIPSLVDGVGSEAGLFQPYGLALDGDILYVSERGNHTIRRISLPTGEVETVAGTGTSGASGDGGPAALATLFGPLGLEVGPDGALYIADTYNHTVRRIDAEGIITTVVGQLGEGGFIDGVPPEETLLNWPSDITFTHEGDLVIVDQLNDRVRMIEGWSATGL